MGYRFIGAHPDELEGGVPVEPGQFLTELDLSLPRNRAFLDDGLIIEADVPDEDDLPNDHPRNLTPPSHQPEAGSEDPEFVTPDNAPVREVSEEERMAESDDEEETA